ncbi:MAG: DinB family protein [Pseudomonadota bacterium]
MDDALVENYRFMARYNRWFNDRLYTACEQLPDARRRRDGGAFFGSIHATLNHLLWSDKVWLGRFAAQGQAFAALPPELLALPPDARHGTTLYADWPALKAERARLDAAVEAWLEELPAGYAVSTLRYANSAGVVREHAAWKGITHFFNHQAHHRGQVTTLLKQAGVDPGVTDMIPLF